jgi:hypothetical protein
MIKWSAGIHSLMLTGHHSGVGNSTKSLEKFIDVFCTSVVGQSCAKVTHEGIYTAGRQLTTQIKPSRHVLESPVDVVVVCERVQICKPIKKQY